MHKKINKQALPLVQHEGFQRFSEAVQKGANNLTRAHVNQVAEYFRYTPDVSQPKKITAQELHYAQLEHEVNTTELAETKSSWSLTNRIETCLTQMVLAVDTHDPAWFEQQSDEYEMLMNYYKRINKIRKSNNAPGGLS